MRELMPDSVSMLMPSDKLYNNPHKGFTTFQRFNGDSLNENWQVNRGYLMEYIPKRKDLIFKTDNDYPDTGIAYFRVPWRTLEPEEGKYKLDYLDEIMNMAELRGQKVMFRFIPHAARPDKLELPEWFLKKLGLKPREVGDKRSPDHPLYYSLYAKLIRKIAEKIDGDERLSAVDMAIVSAWGEDDQISAVSEENWKVIVDAYVQGFKSTPISAQFNHIESILYANSYRPVGLRADCLGNMNWHMFEYPKYFSKLNMLWKKAPISFEVCWVVEHWKNMGWDLDYIIEQSLKWHITTFNAKSAPIPKEWRDKCENWIKKMGYRFSVRRVDYPSRASGGDSLHFSFWFENRGVAPIYHRYPLILRLKSGNKIYDFISKQDITEWLPGDITFDEIIEIPKDISAGKYVLELGIGNGKERVMIATDSPVSDGFNRVTDIIKINVQD